MRFPRGRALLENTNIEFINFDNILHAGKRERSHRIHGYVSLIYPQDVDLIFLSLGEPINAARFSQNSRKLVSINEVVKRVKEANVGIINIYEVPEELVLLMVSTFTLTPILKDKDYTEISVEKMVAQLGKEKFSGFLEIKKGNEYFYSIFEKGLPTRGYFGDKLNVTITPSLLLQILKSTSKDGSNVKFSLFDKLPERIEQATPPTIQLLLKSVNNIIKEFAVSYGPTFAKKGALIAKSHIDDDYKFMKDITITGVELSGDVLATKDEFVKAMAEFVNRFMKTYDVICDDKIKEEIFRKSLKDFRFALKSLGFFNYTMFKDE
ncbi:MAG: hypothetical protein QME48_02225 [bacterium]|nr:hypothetical protein [bacterium]